MKRVLIRLLVVCVLLVASAYITMLTSSSAPTWAPLALAVGANGIIMTLMAIGAMRHDRLPPALVVTFGFIFLACAGAFVAALLMTPQEGAGGPLLLGLPLRTAIVTYTVGVLPIVVLPLAYALTFESSTLSNDDLARVREAYATVQATQRQEGVAP